MTNSGREISPPKAALVAGLGLVVMTIFAVGAIYFVFRRLIVPDNATITINNLVADEMLFRVGISSLVIVAILDVVVAWALYIFLKPVNKSLSLLTAWFRLVYAIILGVALFNYTNVLQLLSGAGNLKVFESERLQADIMQSINAFDNGWAIGLVFFGLHLVLIGYLILRANYIPNILGAVLIVVGLAYFIDNFGMLLIPNYDLGISTFIGWGELLFVVWLLYVGIRLPNQSVHGTT